MGWLLLAAVIAAGAYRYSLWRHPYRPCPRGCKSGSHVDTAVFRKAFGNCWYCHGKGKKVRWGVRLLAPGTYRDITAGRHGRNY
jgi:hypothetical protein